MTARGGLVQGRVSEISTLINVDAGFDQEPRGLEVVPSGSKMQRVLIVTVCCVYIIEQVSIKRSALIQAIEQRHEFWSHRHAPAAPCSPISLLAKLLHPGDDRA
jgi:hypothetical protein